MSETLPEALPAEPAAVGALLDGILERGIERLLQEVKLKGYTQQPHGREPEPSPLLSEEAFLQNGCLDEGEDGEEVDDEPAFDFRYGFNPLQFLADYVRWSHPDSVKERRLERIRCTERLQALAVHAKVQLATACSLRSTALLQGSGVVWGPVCAARSPTTVNAVLQLKRVGTLFIEVATDAAFEAVLKVETVEVDNTDLPTRVQLEGLQPGTRYHLRAYLDEVNPNKEVAVAPSATDLAMAADDDAASNEADAAAQAAEAAAIEAEADAGEVPAAASEEEGEAAAPAAEAEALQDLFLSQSCVVVTPPLTGEEEEAAATAVAAATSGGITLACLPANCARSSSLSVQALGGSNTGYLATCLLGDPFDNHAAQEADGDGYKVDSWAVYCRSRLLTQASSVCRNGGLFLGWNDTRLGSDVDVRSEEVTHKQYQYDLKKHTKKNAKLKSGASGGGGKKDPPPPPDHKRPQLSRSLESLVQQFPVDYSEDGASRSLHKSTKIGADVEVFELDLRGGYLPKAQVKWLKDALAGSTAQWKVVLTGCPLGVGLVPEAEHKEADATTDADATDADAPAAESKEGDAGSSKSVVVAAPEGHDAKKEKDKSRHGRSKEPREELDEDGRPKNSLQYVIASLQRSHERQVLAARAEAAAAQEEEAEEGATAAAEDDAAADEAADPSAICLDSGLVFVSSVSGSSGLPMSPYLATFDPSATGRPYCAEVSVGGSIPSAAAAKEAHMPVRAVHATPKMKTKFVFESGAAVGAADDDNSSGGGAADHSAVLRLEADGDLSVRLLRLRSSAHPDADPTPLEVALLRFKLAQTAE